MSPTSLATTAMMAASETEPALVALAASVVKAAQVVKAD